MLVLKLLDILMNVAHFQALSLCGGVCCALLQIVLLRSITVYVVRGTDVTTTDEEIKG